MPLKHVRHVVPSEYSPGLQHTAPFGHKVLVKYGGAVVATTEPRYDEAAVQPLVPVRSGVGWIQRCSAFEMSRRRKG